MVSQREPRGLPARSCREDAVRAARRCSGRVSDVPSKRCARVGRLGPSAQRAPLAGLTKKGLGSPSIRFRPRPEPPSTRGQRVSSARIRSIPSRTVVRRPPQPGSRGRRLRLPWNTFYRGTPSTVEHLPGRDSWPRVSEASSWFARRSRRVRCSQARPVEPLPAPEPRRENGAHRSSCRAAPRRGCEARGS